MTRPILVTGAGGRVGSALMQLSRTLVPSRNDIQGDMVREVRQHDAAAIINLAACTLPDAERRKPQARNVNDIAVWRMAEEVGVPIVHISTDCVFSGDQTRHYDEWTPTAPQNWYGHTKRGGELALEGGPHIIIRTTGVFLAGRPNFAETVLQRAGKGEPLEIVSDTTFTPTHATELARAILIATERLIEDHSVSGTYHFAGPECLSYLDFAEMILAEAELDTPIKAVTQAEREAIEGFKRPKNACLDSSKFTQTFGYTHRPLRDCVREVVNAARVSAPA